MILGQRGFRTEGRGGVSLSWSLSFEGVRAEGCQFELEFEF